MKSKKAVGHVEVIISFVIFAGFVLFLFLLFNPFKNKFSEGSINTVHLDLEQKLQTNLSKVSIKINEVQDEICFSIPILEDMNCNHERNFIVKNSSSNITKAVIQENIMIIQTSSRDGFYTLYCSDELQSESFFPSNCRILSEGEYNLGKISLENVWSAKKLEKFNENYTINYEQLKSEIIPQNKDFGFTISDLDGKVIFNILKPIPKSIDVRAKQFTIDLLKSNGEIKKEILNLIIW